MVKDPLQNEDIISLVEAYEYSGLTHDFLRQLASKGKLRARILLYGRGPVSRTKLKWGKRGRCFFDCTIFRAERKGVQRNKGALERIVGHPSHLPIFRNARSRAATRISLT
jgi:hypothetical protein